MELIEALRNEPTLAHAICSDCSENEVSVTLDAAIPLDKVLIIKVDEYYQNLYQEKRPRSVDCLIIQYCESKTYHIYLVELKNVAYATKLDKTEIQEKFQATLHDFMSYRFRNFFYNTNYNLDIRLILVAGTIKKSRLITYKLDFLLTLPPFYFANKRYAIAHNSPNPEIQVC